MFLYYILTFIIICNTCDAAKILAVFPAPFISHQVVFRPLTQELAKRGHEVVVITTEPAFPKGNSPERLTEIDVHDISHKIWKDEMLFSGTSPGENVDTNIITQMKKTLILLSKIFEKMVETDEVQKLITDDSGNFDLLLAEACVRPVTALSHVFKVPIILMSSFGGSLRNYDNMGVPMRPPLHYPTVLRQRIYNLTFWEKITELYNHYLFEDVFASVENVENKMIKSLFGPETPTISELDNNVHMLFLNVHPLWELNRPVPPSVIFLGGMHQTRSKKLPKEMQSYLDSSKNGVIYCSFGTNVIPSRMSPERVQMLVRVFSKLPYDVLWKWDKNELPGKSHNIRISKWLPQSDLLKHPKVKLFITQGGLQSTDEAITAGVPLIGLPMIADQWYNVEQYVYHKIGLKLDFGTMTDKMFLAGINTILNDDSYRRNVVNLGVIMRDQPQAPLERAVWWTEHVLRHGGAPHLRARVANMPWTEYLDLQLMLVAGLALLLVLLVFNFSMYLLFSLVKTNLPTKVKLKRT